MSIRVTKANTRLEKGATEFGIRDQKGRAVGYTWTIDRVVHTPIAEGDPTRSFYTLEAGEPLEYYEVVSSPTRDGERYGPAFNRAEAPTLDGARAIVLKRTENARKSNTKKFVK